MSDKLADRLALLSAVKRSCKVSRAGRRVAVVVLVVVVSVVVVFDAVVAVVLVVAFSHRAP